MNSSTDSKRGKYAQWSDDSLKLAVKAVLIDGRSKKSVAKQYGLPRQTLQGYVKRAVADSGVEKLRAGHPTTLSSLEEEQLVEVLLTMSQRLFGLSPKVVKLMVFQYCEDNAITHRFNNADKSAGKEWFKGFMKRHAVLSVRVAEATSLQRAIGFNRTKVNSFYDELEKIMFDSNGTQVIPPMNIFNVDESGMTVCHKPGKVVAQRGKHSVGGLTSAEKGNTITVVCCQSAGGFYVPPMLIYPRARVRPEFLDKAPIGSVSAGSKNGWITLELFEKWFDHFVQAVHPEARREPVLLVLDGHSSHTRNLNVIKKARQSNVIILSLPSHCTHRLQPLDVAFFKSLNAFYDQATATWLRQHPGRPVTELEVGELFGTAYGKAATVQNAQSGFKKSGIYPFDRNIFTDEDFAAADATDRPYVTPTTDQDGGSELHSAQEGTAAADEVDENNLVTLHAAQLSLSVSSTVSQDLASNALSSSTVKRCEEQSSADVNLVSLLSEVIAVSLDSTASSSSPVQRCEEQSSSDVNTASLSLEVIDGSPDSTASSPSSVQRCEEQSSADVNTVSLVLEVIDGSSNSTATSPSPVQRCEEQSSADVNTVSISLETIDGSSVPSSAAETPSGRTSTGSTFRSLAGLEIKNTPRAPGKRRKVNHAEIITASPYKSQLEESITSKNLKRQPNKRGKKPANCMKDSEKDEHVQETKSSTAHATVADIDGVEDAVDKEPCVRCKYAFADPRDPHLKDAWDMCKKCCRWWHETCAALCGVYVKQKFTCDECKPSYRCQKRQKRRI